LLKIQLLFSGFLVGFGAATLYTMSSGWSHDLVWAVAHNLYGEGPIELALTVAFMALGCFAAIKGALLMTAQDETLQDRPVAPRGPTSLL